MNITHDFHVHTSLSLCGDKSATPENYLAIAKRLGLKKIGFSDHFWDETIPTDHLSQMAKDFYIPQNYPYMRQLKPKLDAMDWGDTKVYFGAEAEYDYKRRGVCVSEAVAEQLDFLIVPNSHTHLVMPHEFYEPKQKHLDFMIQAYEDILNSPVSRYITAMAHPFEAVCCPYDNNILIHMLSDDTLKRLCDQTAEKGIAFEINVASMVHKSYQEIVDCSQMRMFRIAKECGCKFLFGSDAHNNWVHDVYSNADLVADLLGLTEDDLHPIAR